MKERNLKYKILSITILSAAAFVGFAAINYAYAWPLIFPLAGGFAAMAINRTSTATKTFGNLIKYTLYTIPMIILITIPVLANSSEAQINEVRRLGFENTEIFALSLIIGGILCVVYLVAFAIGALLGKMVNESSPAEKESEQTTA